MALWPLTGEILVTFALSAILLYRYGNWSTQNVITTISVFIAWFFSFIVIFILPLDISTTAYIQCQDEWNQTHANSSHAGSGVVTTAAPHVLLANETGSGNSTFIPTTSNITSECQEPWSYVPGKVLVSLWRIVYWTGQVMTWLILPIMQSYSMAGDFSTLKKLKSAFIENLIFYGIFAATFLVLLVYVSIHHTLSMEYLKVICITAANTWGLLLLIVLLGYGLVEIPKSVYESSRHNRRLNYYYFKVAKLSAEKCEADEKLDDALEQIQHTFEAVITTHQHLRPLIEVILDKCPLDWREKLLNKYSSVPQDRPRGNRIVAYNEQDLVRLHSNILRAGQAHHRTHVQWNLLIDEVIGWEDVSKNSMNPSHEYRPSFPSHVEFWNIPVLQQLVGILYTPKIEWYWKCRIRSPFLKGLGVSLAILSFMVIWSELTFSIANPKLSVFALLLDVCKKTESYFVTEVFCIAALTYLCICSYYTLFKIRVFNYYYLASHHQTDEYSLIFCGMLLCRLAPPLCLNFLSLMHLDSHVTKLPEGMETSFTSIMGHMDVIPWISEGFNIYLPMVMCFFCLATFLEIGTRFLHFMGIEQFIVDDEMTGDLMKDGMDLVKREKNKRSKQIDVRSRSNPSYAFAESLSSSRPGPGYGGDSRSSREPHTEPSENARSRGDLLRGDSGEAAGIGLLGDSEPVDYATTRNLDRSLQSRQFSHQPSPSSNIFDDV